MQNSFFSYALQLILIIGLMLGCTVDSKHEMTLFLTKDINTAEHIHDLSTCHYYLARTQEENIRARLLQKKGLSLAIERDSELYLAAEKAFAQAKPIFVQEGDLVNLTKLTINQAVNWMQLGDTLAFLHVMDSLLQPEAHTSDFLGYYKHVNLGDYYHRIGNVEKAKRHYLAGLEMLPKEPCNNYRDILNSYLADIYLQENKLDTVELYVQKMRSYINCPGVDSSQVRYYLQETYYQFALARLSIGDTFDLHKIVTLLYDRRDYATQMFENEDEFHLGDLYDQNTHRILSAYQNLFGEEIPQSEFNRLTNLLYDNTWRKVKKEELATLTYEQKAREQEINKLLKEVNDFKNDFGYDDPAYERLYELLVLEAEPTTKKLSVPMPDLEIEPNALYSVFHSYASNLWRIDLLNGQARIHKLDYENVQRLTRKLQTTIVGKYSDVSNIAALVHQEILAASEYSSHYIVKDPVTGAIPFAAITSKDIILDHTFCEHDTTHLQRSNHAIFSYSDSMSINDVREKEFIELASGLKESRSVHSILSGGKLLMDEQVTRSELLANSDMDIIHIATHAVVNSAVRQDCYLVVNDEDGNARKFYGYDISSMNGSPKFVNLSACDTGVGYTLAGNGTYSLSREFIRNGSGAVLKTLWPVDDKATLLFQTQLYRNWIEGRSLGQSISLSREHMKVSEEYAHAYYWAAFMLEGNPNLYLE